MVGLAVYVLAVFHRSSLGVAGLLAQDRFHINAVQLSLFTVLQLVVYAGPQIPIGVLLDRFGSRALTLWFLIRQAPVVTQVTGQLGQVGAILATAPRDAFAHLGFHEREGV